MHYHGQFCDFEMNFSFTTYIFILILDKIINKYNKQMEKFQNINNNKIHYKNNNLGYQISKEVCFYINISFVFYNFRNLFISN